MPISSFSPQWIVLGRTTPVLFSLGDWIALLHPVRAKIFRNIEHFHVGKTQRSQCIIGWLDVRTMAPWATSAIDDDELLSGQRLHTLTQLLYAAFVGSRADVLGPGNMRLLVKNVGPHLNHEWLFAFGRLKDFNQFVRV